MEKDSNRNDSKDIQKNNELSVFIDNPSLSFIHRKVEKISSALHLITNHLSEREPLRWNIRKGSLDLIKDIFLFRNNISKESKFFENFKFKLNELISYLDILSNTGLISSVNYSILKQEIASLLEYLGPDYDLNRNTISQFNNQFFGVSIPSPTKASLENKVIDNLLDTKIYQGQDYKSHLYKGHSGIKDMTFKKAEKDIYKRQNDKTSQDRKAIIIAFIKDSKEVTIKDITSFIKDFSEKTIQRDLVSLVKDGILKRKGERRWSRYMLS